MKPNEAIEKIYYAPYGDMRVNDPITENDIEYVRKDAFIKKAKKWFEKHNEWFDPNGVRHCDIEDFEDFRKYMEGE